MKAAKDKLNYMCSKFGLNHKDVIKQSQYVDELVLIEQRKRFDELRQNK